MRKQLQAMSGEECQWLMEMLQQRMAKEEQEEKVREEKGEEDEMDQLVMQLLQGWMKVAKRVKDSVGLKWLEEEWEEWQRIPNRTSKSYHLHDFQEGDEVNPEDLEGLGEGDAVAEYPTCIEQSWHRFNQERGCQQYAPSAVWQEFQQMKRDREEEMKEAEGEGIKEEEGKEERNLKVQGLIQRQLVSLQTQHIIL